MMDLVVGNVETKLKNLSMPPSGPQPTPRSVLFLRRSIPPTWQRDFGEIKSTVKRSRMPKKSRCRAECEEADGADPKAKNRRKGPDESPSTDVGAVVN